MSNTKMNFTYNTLLGLTNIIVPIITFPYASRVLGPQGIGITSFAISLVTTFVILGSLGIPIYGIREIAKSKKDKTKLSNTFSELLLIQVFWSVFIIIAFASWLYFTKTYQNEDAIKYLSFIHIFCSIGLINWFYQGIEKYKFISIVNFISKLLTIALLFILVKQKEDYWLYYFIVVMSSLVSAIISITYSFKFVKYKLVKLNFKRHYKPILILFSTQIAITIYLNLDVIMLKYLSQLEQVGYYSAAIRIIKTLLILVTSLGVVLIPKISSYIYEKNNNEVRVLVEKSINFVLIISFPMMIGLCLVSKDIIILFAGSQFGIASSLLLWLVPLIFLIGMNNIFGLQILVPFNGEKKLMFIVIFGAVLNFSLNFFLIPIYQGKGAAFSTLVTEGIITVLAYYFSKKELGFKFPIKKFLTYLILSLFFIPIVGLISLVFEGIFYVIVATFVCAVLYFFALIVIKDKFFIENMYKPVLLKLNL
ncbi:MAG: hypothetical protein COW44_12955 [Flavobacteriaceae bacterium CG17_big_fil_post_rev_8_21_14_2_50_33_15]|nr:MAG: hypothetical protein COW44_12955 [Flavobacteriaceae bacterium CG17_big_fil_post_rev_8_21_14_2_50_33_15]